MVVVRGVLRQLIKGTRTAPTTPGQMIHPLLFAGHGLRFRKLEVILTTVGSHKSIMALVLSFFLEVIGIFLLDVEKLLIRWCVQSIEKLGKAGETVKVAPGYFRNHLMPKLLAVPNIEKYAYLVREQRKVNLLFVFH